MNDGYSSLHFEKIVGPNDTLGVEVDLRLTRKRMMWVVGVLLATTLGTIAWIYSQDGMYYHHLDRSTGIEWTGWMWPHGKMSLRANNGKSWFKLDGSEHGQLLFLNAQYLMPPKFRYQGRFKMHGDGICRDFSKVTQENEAFIVSEGKVYVFQNGKYIPSAKVTWTMQQWDRNEKKVWECLDANGNPTGTSSGCVHECPPSGNLPFTSMYF